MEKIAIIGGGIAGASIARVLSKYENLEIHLIEREPDVSWGVTKANTGIIHPGHEEDPEKHSLRADFCVEGNELWHRWTEELDIPVEWPGELMIARREGELKTLEKYLELGKENGVPGLRIIDEEELRTLEPNVNSEAQSALYGPTAGRMEPWEAVIGLVENSVENGLITHLNTEVRDIGIKQEEIRGVQTGRGFIEADIIVNAAGLYADEVSKMAGIDHFDLQPRKGEYYLFDEDARPRVKRILHPVPTSKTKGVYATKTVGGNLMLGPTAEDLPMEAKGDNSTTEEGLNFVWKEAKNLVEELPKKEKVSKTFAGLRPEPPEGRYVIEAHEDPWGFVSVGGIRSPGLTAAPAIANYVVEELIEGELGVKLAENKDWNPKRKGIKRFSEVTMEERRKLIAQDPNYGNVVCMCKEVTRAEILEAIERAKKVGVSKPTLDSVKFRTLAMFGFCQGSFCRLKTAKILSEELDIPIWKVTIRGEGTKYGMGDVKILRSKKREKDEQSNEKK
ncbi:glycerol-3-phosphate dehydrogenase [candidate division MSBL1 archaeon SCGC-AAA259E19]|uniref:Glycerol-3-phosphate dehydrogenase n=1 Tax=candidate division MSBL1 archaeon SCGC-AAA259E19 TaxID=1698264 RepID=A0A133UL12_9EURY|nr:glycerol-3-phosphate dehydrogenase [candidate division MSBL1 archaeon SCGC-AAA259E19]